MHGAACSRSLCKRMRRHAHECASKMTGVAGTVLRVLRGKAVRLLCVGCSIALLGKVSSSEAAGQGHLVALPP